MVNSLLWFRRDLRLTEHRALTAAAAQGSVLAVFVADESLLTGAGEVRKAYLARTLAALDADLAGRLLIVHGPPARVIPFLARSVGATSVHVTADHGPYGRRRDDRVAAALERHDIAWVPSGSAYSVEPGTIRKPDGTPYAVFAPWFRGWLDRLAPQLSPTPTVGWLDPATVDLGRGRRWLPAELTQTVPDGLLLPPAGEAAAHRRWAQFRDGPLQDYETDRDRPDRGGTSQLSPDLKWGTIHPDRLLVELAGLDGPGAAAYRRELAFREFYADILGARPTAATLSVDPSVDRMTWHTDDDAQERWWAWKAGRTGYPYIDAGLRQLLTTGWMHNRVRMAVASFLVKDLHLPWQWGARHFMNHLVDGDVASNSQGWQWVAGAGPHAAPFYRVFNPIGQGEKHDPDGNYVRRFIPELRQVSGKAVHRPWELPAGPPDGYPLPLVDHAAERAVALADWAARPR